MSPICFSIPDHAYKWKSIKAKCFLVKNQQKYQARKQAWRVQMYPEAPSEISIKECSVESHSLNATMRPQRRFWSGSDPAIISSLFKTQWSIYSYGSHWWLEISNIIWNCREHTQITYDFQNPCCQAAALKELHRYLASIVSFYKRRFPTLYWAVALTYFWSFVEHSCHI